MKINEINKFFNKIQGGFLDSLTVCINAVADLKALIFQFSTKFCTKIQTLNLAQNRYCVYILLGTGLVQILSLIQ